MSAHKSLLQTSDFIAYMSIVVALFVEWIIPSDLNIHRNISIILGIFLLLTFWTIIFTTKWQFRKINQKTGPNNETTLLIKDGIFAYSRNPIYFAVLFLGPSLGFIINSLWLIVSIIPIFILIKYFLIIPEEKYLSIKFGKEYVYYCEKVRRWI